MAPPPTSPTPRRLIVQSPYLRESQTYSKHTSAAYCHRYLDTHTGEESASSLRHLKWFRMVSRQCAMLDFGRQRVRTSPDLPYHLLFKFGFLGSPPVVDYL
jgi:hypothetical protein